MSIKILLVIFVFGSSLFSHARGKLLLATSTNEQDVVRLELQFENLVDPSKIGIQFVNKNIILSVPESELKKDQPPLDLKSTFIDSVGFTSNSSKGIDIEIQFSEISALQMRENLAIEGLGKALIVEILPPVWNKNVTSNNQNGLVLPENTSKSLVAHDSNKGLFPEKEIPLFKKPEEKGAEHSSSYKIGFLLFSIVGLGGYLAWWLKKKSKMVNGPESLMKIKMITQFHLGPKKSLAVIRVAGESLLLGLTETQISLIKTLSLLDEEIPEVSNQDFSDSLEDQESVVSQKTSKSNTESGFDEEFSFGPAVKTTLSDRLPKLRRLV